ncbi:TetR/AcrR family transcriptional regulator [Nocardioides sp. CPCC 206347]|uniref:TetR/AcrR family transcriptional regulator n=1 Tax=unclassified Nocardioides TaxID=2615069 RepID=UPI003613171C
MPKPRPSADLAPGSLRERLLVATAVEVSEVGVDGVSLRAIARRIGVSHQAPAHVFGSRRGLLTALATEAVVRMRDELIAAAEETRASGKSGAQVVVAIGQHYIEVALREQALFALASRSEVLDLTDPDLVRARNEAWLVLVNAVTDAQAEGWREGQPTNVVALMCWSLVQGLAVIYRDRLAPEEIATQSPEDLARKIADLL